MVGIGDIATGILVTAVATGATAQSQPPEPSPITANAEASDPAQALFTRLKAGVALQADDMKAAIVTLKNGATLSPDKDFAVVVDKAKGTFAALKLTLTEENRFVVEAPPSPPFRPMRPPGLMTATSLTTRLKPLPNC